MAPYILAEEKDLIALPDELTYKDGAQVACGFGTVYEAIEKIGICGNDAVLVTGMGPVGLAALMLAKCMGANKLIGVEMNDYRIDLAKKLAAGAWKGRLMPAPTMREDSWQSGLQGNGARLLS